LKRLSTRLFDPFPRGILSIQGNDRSLFLHRLLTQDVKSLKTGHGKPACLLDRGGKIQFAGFLHAQPDELLLELEVAQRELAVSLLEKYLISEAVTLSDQSDRYRILPLHGPNSLEIVASVWPKLKLPSAAREHVSGPPDSGIFLLARTDLLRGPGLHLWVAPKQVGALREKLLEAGAALGLEAAPLEDLEPLRIEAGVPWPGKELTSDVILNELGDEEWVSFTKGCFIGQEIVARIKYRAHPPRLLTGFLVEGSEIPASGSVIQSEGTDLGRITSACLSPTLKRVIAMGFLKHGTDKQPLKIPTANGPLSLQTTPLPFVSG